MTVRRPSIEERLRDLDTTRRIGRVDAVIGDVIHAQLPDVRIGEICEIEGEPPVRARVVGFRKDHAILMPLTSLEGLTSRAAIRPDTQHPHVPAGPEVLGRVLDGLGRPLDGRPLAGSTAPLHRTPPDPLRRERITEPLHTGIRAIDAMLTIGRGQRVGLFAAAGVGKSTLLSALARNVDADVVVLALIGERGREVRGFLEDDLGEEGRRKSVVVVSTADQPALCRIRAATTATAIAEAYRDEGRHVVLLVDSITRYARALRDVGLAADEPVGRQGYPASVFSELPKLFERAGTGEQGSITAIYTVLVSGDDLTEPVADETMSLLDGHIILSRDLAARGHYPAIDVSRSKSRLMNDIAGPEHRDAASWVAESLATFEKNEMAISLGKFDPPPGDPAHRFVDAHPDVMAFLRQSLEEAAPFDDTLRRLLALPR